ncbi:GntR family transcriptional regulator [Agrococcus jejuensis]|uniref:GntR family transcriptional regulator n=1 Tax=Agrococcus jejuensis TaxID=399736 RepID=A0A1G8B5H5_9MICO|nr:GntR family transcriptional regulator [Agrococcus jejuensis]SDH28395.1 GntR family transcriptional regulator [Agrococcus jejuensis]
MESAREQQAAPQRLRYREVAAAIDVEIASGAVAVGSRLPSEATLAARHDVARGTVRKALAHLQRRGVVAPQRGAGWVVQSPVRAYGLAGFRSFAQWARSRGLEPGGLVVASADAIADAALARRMRIPVGDAVLHVTRVRTLDGQRVMVERSTYPSWVAPVVRDQPRDAPSVAELLADAGFAEAEGSHRLDAVAASSDDARLLGVPRSSPLLLVDRHAIGADGRTIDVSDDRYLPGTVTFEVRSDGR